MRRITLRDTVVSLLLALLVTFVTCAQMQAKTWEELLSEGKRLQSEKLYDSAAIISLQALDLAENEFGPFDSTVGVIAHSIGGMYLGGHRFKDARKYELIALEVWDSIPGLQLPIEAFTLHNLAAAEKEIGMSSAAETHFERAVALKRQSPKVKPISLANSVLALADIMANGGWLVEAELLAKEAIDIRTLHLGPDALKTHEARNVLGHVYHFQRKAREAATIYKQVADAFLNSGDTAQALAYVNNLAAQYNQLELYDKAESTLTDLLAILPDIKVAGVKVKPLALKNLGRTYFFQKRYEEAEACQLREIELVRDIHGANHNDYFRSIYNLANTYRESGRLVAADSLYCDLIERCSRAYDSEHPMVGSGSRERAILHLRRNLSDSAVALASSAFTNFAGRFYRDLALLNEAAAFGYSSHMRRAAEVYISSLLALENPTPLAMKEAADIILSVKGPVSDEIINRDRFLRECKDPNIKTLFESYKKARLEAAELAATEERSEQSDTRTESITEEIEELERKLVAASGHFREYAGSELVTADEVIRQLPPNSILFEFMRMGRFDDVDSTQQGRLICLTITDEGVESIHDLGKNDEIESLVAEYRRHLRRIESQDHFPTSDDLAEYESLAEKLYHTVWQPLESDIGSRKTIILSPDGILNLVSFAGLKNSQGHYLVEDLTIQYLSAGRDLLNPTESGARESHLLAVGDPDYDASVEDRAARLKEAAFASFDETSPVPRTRGRGTPSRSVGDLHMDRLYGTQKEIEQILKDSTLFSSTTVLTGASATEDEFKKQAPQATTIHLATHGFYLRSDYPESDFGLDPLTMFGRPSNPLMESGLFFAGGNLHGEGADSAGIDDGILFAEEVTMMDLRNAELVVLSACETGLGELQEGEGVFGLRKAFRIAGAKTVVSALWSVPDQQTTDLMGELYKSSDLRIAERVRAAQLALIDKMRRDGDPTHPYLWAGFISVGN